MNNQRFPSRRGGNFRGQRRRKPFTGQFNSNQRASEMKYVYTPTVEASPQVYVPSFEFENLAIDPQIKRNIQAHGYETPTPIQDQAIPVILEGRDVIGVAATGTGKTAAFLIPMLDKVSRDRSASILILEPTRELATQVFNEFKLFAAATNIHAALCIGGTNMGRQIREIRRRPAFVIGTPGRLRDLISQRHLNLSTIANVVLDEVDRMVDIGFIKDIQSIIALLPKKRQSLFFSATVSGEVKSIVQSFVVDPVTITIKSQLNGNHINQDVIHVRSKDEKISKLLELLRKQEFQKVIVFGRTRWGVERLSQTLQQQGIASASIHGNKSQNQRLRALNIFRQSHIQTLVATDVAARGLDIPDITHVINFDEPESQDNYIHRIGRTGRVNKQGHAITFVG